MLIEPTDFQKRLRELAGFEGIELTQEELSGVAACYPSCGGTDLWDVREYARIALAGAREYRVVRGSGVKDVFRSTERSRAAAVRAALNDLEFQRDPGRGV
jgi:hypothetical protein